MVLPLAAVLERINPALARGGDELACLAAAHLPAHHASAQPSGHRCRHAAGFRAVDERLRRTARAWRRQRDRDDDADAADHVRDARTGRAARRNPCCWSASCSPFSLFYRRALARRAAGRHEGARHRERAAGRAMSCVFFCYLESPLAFILLASFNNGLTVHFPPTGFSFQWYSALWDLVREVPGREAGPRRFGRDQHLARTREHSRRRRRRHARPRSRCIGSAFRDGSCCGSSSSCRCYSRRS